MSTTLSAAPKGLEGVVATNSSICYIDGDRGVLAYRGIDIHELADHSTFEEVCYLLWYGKLPTRQELEQLPIAYSVVFMLRDIEGFSTAEVADALHITISATKVRLLRARLKLRDKLGVHFESRVKQARAARAAAAAAAGIGFMPAATSYAGD